MGHANFTNISAVVNRRVKNGTTIRECVDELENSGQAVHASEGDLHDRYMLAFACGEIVGWLYKTCLISPKTTTKEQDQILKEWDAGENMDWDNGDDGEEGKYGIFDSIEWTTNRKRLPILKYFTN